MPDIKDYEALPLKAIHYHHLKHTIYLLQAREGDTMRPIRLGTGRNAVVFLGSDTPLDNVGIKYLAIKFLKDDPDPEYARVSEERFFTEAEKTKTFGQMGAWFVQYNCFGLVKPQLSDKEIAYWQKRFGDTIADDVNTDAELIKVLGYYKLQGPFYALELCQATLYDLLDRDTSWLDLPLYKQQPPLPSKYVNLVSYSKALQQSADSVSEAISEVSDCYIDGGIYKKSGYDILNAFKDNNDANSVRNYAVLELFSHIAYTVKELHSIGLAHRDMKPGNVFLSHYAENRGIGQPRILLGDLGYTADSTSLQTAEFSLKGGIRNPEASVPGSQFYRAPEQAELPIEVRISFDRDTPDHVHVRSSKISNIRRGDRLVISDSFKEPDDQDNEGRVFIIREILYDEKVYHRENQRDASHRERLITGFILNEGLDIDNNEDIAAHVVRATGYHTDGYSLGAILYDLASGGRNPELFYTYCLVRFLKEFSQVEYTIADVLEALSPETSILPSKEEEGVPTQGRSRGTLRSFESAAAAPAARQLPGSKWDRQQLSAEARTRPVPAHLKLKGFDGAGLGKHMLQAENVEDAVLRLLNSGLDAKVNQPDGEEPQLTSDLLTTRDKWALLKLVMGADSIDDLVGLILHSQLDEKIAHLRAAGAAPAPNTLNIAEKWELLGLVMDAQEIHSLLDMILNSSLERAVVAESQPTPSHLTLPEKWDILRLTMRADTVEELIPFVLSSAVAVKVGQLSQQADTARTLTLAERWEVLRLVMGAEKIEDLIEYILASSLNNRMAFRPEERSTLESGSSISPRKKWDFLKIVLQANNLDTLITDLLDSATSYDRTELSEALRNYRFRNFHIVKDLLQDKRGVSIPKDIIELIVCCMLRDMQGSYYTNEIGQGFLAGKNMEAAGEIYDQTKWLLNQPHNQLPRDFPSKLRDDLLFKLRSMAFVTQEQGEAGSAPPQTTAQASLASTASATSAYAQSVGGVPTPMATQAPAPPVAPMPSTQPVGSVVQEAAPEEPATLTPELDDSEAIAPTRAVEPPIDVSTAGMPDPEHPVKADKKASGRKGLRNATSQ